MGEAGKELLDELELLRLFSKLLLCLSLSLSLSPSLSLTLLYFHYEFLPPNRLTCCIIHQVCEELIPKQQ